MNKENRDYAADNGNCENSDQEGPASITKPMLGIGCGLTQMAPAVEKNETQSKLKAPPTVEINLSEVKQTDTLPVDSCNTLTM